LATSTTRPDFLIDRYTSQASGAINPQKEVSTFNSTAKWPTPRIRVIFGLFDYLAFKSSDILLANFGFQKEYEIRKYILIGK